MRFEDWPDRGIIKALLPLQTAKNILDAISIASQILDIDLRSSSGIGFYNSQITLPDLKKTDPPPPDCPYIICNLLVTKKGCELYIVLHTEESASEFSPLQKLHKVTWRIIEIQEYSGTDRSWLANEVVGAVTALEREANSFVKRKTGL